MKRVLVIAMVILFSVGVIGAFAADAPQSQVPRSEQKGTWMKKDVERHVFQDPADAINKWHTTTRSSEKFSLRNNKAELMRRRGNVMKGKLLKV